MPLGIRPYPRSHKLALPLYTYPQPKALRQGDLPATRPIGICKDFATSLTSGETNSRCFARYLSPRRRYISHGRSRSLRLNNLRTN